MWNSGDLFGCEFVAPVPNAAISASLLQNPIERPNAAPPVAETPPPQDSGYAAAVVDEETTDRARLPLGTRALIIVGSSLLAWTLIIWAIARSL